MLVSAQGWNKALRTLNEFGVLDSVFGVPKELGDVSSELKIGSDISAKLAELLATDLTKFLFLFFSCLLNIINDIAFLIFFFAHLINTIQINTSERFLSHCRNFWEIS